MTTTDTIPFAAPGSAGSARVPDGAGLLRVPDGAGLLRAPDGATPLRAPSPPGPVEWIARPGHAPYEAAVARMAARVAAIRRGEAAECVELLEHPPLLTAGTSARDADLLDPAALPIHRVGRGGQWTYHGPGQRIAYVMLDLDRRHGDVPARDIRAFVAGLERWLVAVLATFGVDAGTRNGRVGLWVVDPATGAENKIAAIGVRATRWVTSHGIALNVAPDLSAYRGIVPCGIAAHGVTSLRALGVETTPEAIDAALRRAWAGVFGEP